jgi:hypothetical protein
VVCGILKHGPTVWGSPPGPAAQGSQAAPAAPGDFAKENALRPEKGLPPDMSKHVRNVILSCHSGGGWPMHRLAVGMTGKGGKYGAMLRECWGFDCLYHLHTTITIPPQDASPENQWFQWARANPNVQLYFPWYGTKSRSKGLDWLAKQPPGRPNVHVIPDLYDAPAAGKKDPTPKEKVASLSPDHCKAPITFWETRINAAKLQ